MELSTILASNQRCILAFFLTIVSPAFLVISIAGNEFEPSPDEDFSQATCDSLTLQTTPNRRIYGQTEAMFFDFDHLGHDRPVALRLLPDGGTEFVLWADDANGDALGPRVTLGSIGTDYRGWEATYFGADGGKGTATASGEDDLAMVGDLALASIDFFKSDRIAIESQTRLHSLEFSRTWYSQNWRWLAGFRYFRIDDNFRLVSFDLDSGSEPSVNDSFGDYKVRAENDLFGLQSGIRYSRSPHFTDSLLFEIGCKAGIYGNSASQKQSVLDFGGTEDVFFLREPSGDHRGQVAFLGDANANIVLSLNSSLALTAGYQLIWVEGVALASDQLEFDIVPRPRVTTSGGGIIHGANIGLKFSW